MAVGDAEGRSVLPGSAGDLSTDVIGNLDYPIRGHRFVVELQNLGIASFKSVDGFTSEISPLEYREGTWATLGMRRVPGMLSYPDITLTKGMYNSLTLYDYFMGYLKGTSVKVENMTITVYSNAGNAVAKWIAFNVWPMRYEAGGLNADSSEIIIETVTFVTEGVYRETLG